MKSNKYKSSKAEGWVDMSGGVGGGENTYSDLNRDIAHITKGRMSADPGFPVCPPP